MTGVRRVLFRSDHLYDQADKEINARMKPTSVPSIDPHGEGMMSTLRRVSAAFSNDPQFQEIERKHAEKEENSVKDYVSKNKDLDSYDQFKKHWYSDESQSGMISPPKESRFRSLINKLTKRNVIPFRKK